MNRTERKHWNNEEVSLVVTGGRFWVMGARWSDCCGFWIYELRQFRELADGSIESGCTINMPEDCVVAQVSA